MSAIRPQFINIVNHIGGRWQVETRKAFLTISTSVAVDLSITSDNISAVTEVFSFAKHLPYSFLIRAPSWTENIRLSGTGKYRCKKNGRCVMTHPP